MQLLSSEVTSSEEDKSDESDYDDDNELEFKFFIYNYFIGYIFTVEFDLSRSISETSL